MASLWVPVKSSAAPCGVLNNFAVRPVCEIPRLHKIQQLTIDRAMFAPIMDLRALTGVGPRVVDHTINSLPMVPFPSWEDMRLKSQ